MEGLAISTWTYTLELGDRSITLEEGVSTLGRSRNCTVTLADASASRTHAELEASNGTIILRDLGSSNGTYVDGARVVGQSPLRNGSLITIGETVMTVRMKPATPAAQEPPPKQEDVAATVRIEAIPRSALPSPPAASPQPGAPQPAAPQVPEPVAAPSLRATSPAPSAPSLESSPPLAAPALGGLPPAGPPPLERPVSRTDVFSPLAPTPAGPTAVEKTMLEVPTTPAPPRPSPPRPSTPPPPRPPGGGVRPAPPALDDMRPREGAAPPPPPPGDILGSIDALDHTALGARAVRTPPPPMARPVGAPVGRPAGFWLRFGALLVDGVAVGLPLAALNFVLTFVIPVETAALLGSLLGMVVGLGLPLVCWALWGRTPGKALLKIAVVAEGSNTPGIGFGKAIVRIVGYVISGVILGIGFLMAGFGDKRALHDRIAGTRVIRL